MKPQKAFVWTLQLFVSLVLIMAGVMKFTSPEMSPVFDALGLGHGTMIFIGILELVAGVFLLVPLTAEIGALLATGVMLGAFLAHATVLGYTEPKTYVGLVLLICSFIILYIRRKEFPVFGDELE